MKKVRYTNTDWGKQYYLDYPALSKDSTRRRTQKVFLKRFSKCGLFHPACEGINVSAKTVQRWMEKDEWFRGETHEAFKFVIDHYGQELELVPPNRRHKLFALFRVLYEGKQIYDLNGVEAERDEIINEDGVRERIMTPLEGNEEYHYQTLISAELDKIRHRDDYCEGDMTQEGMRLTEELKARKALTAA